MTANENIKSLIRAPYYIGAIVLFQRNIKSIDQLASLVRDLQQIAKEAGHTRPLLIGIDQENGLVTRIKPPVATQLPGSMAIGATGSTEAALRVSRATGELLGFFGINMNYAPCCDINSEPLNPVIGVRSPGDDGEMVGRFSSAMAQGLRERKVIPCIKHFPGHGDTNVDSHYGLPIVNKGVESLETCELVPFRRAVAEGVEAVMTAHIVVPSLDNLGLPATLSKDFMEILRERLQYNGLIITDCLEMDAVRATFGTAAGAVKSLEAGADCVMICHTRSVQIQAYENVLSAVSSGSLPADKLMKSADRVDMLKSKFLDWEDAINSHNSFESIRSITNAHEKLSDELYSRTTTVIRDDQKALPLSSHGLIAYVYPVEYSDRISVSGIIESSEIISCIPSCFLDILKAQASHVVECPFQENRDLDGTVEAQVSRADTVILVTRNARISTYQKFMGARLALLTKKLITVATCDPYDFVDVADVKTCIAMYEPTAEAFYSAVQLIFGAKKPLGTMPVLGDPEQFPFHVKPFDSVVELPSLVPLWHYVIPQYAIPAQRLKNLLTRPNGSHFVARDDKKLVGFIAAFTNETPVGPKSFISALIVHPSYRHHGIGTKLIRHARTHLLKNNKTRFVSIGSGSPYFWPGVPLDIPQQYQAFFKHRGFIPTTGPTARDYMADLQDYAAPEGVMQRTAAAGVTFMPWTKEQYEECLVKQKKFFGHNCVWVNAYEQLAEANQHHQVMVAMNSSGEQLGWTLMLDSDMGRLADLACPPLLGEKTGLIACVGVDPNARGKGVGLALIASAALHLKAKGLQNVFIDWVILENWYEKAGFKVWREYRPMTLRELAP